MFQLYRIGVDVVNDEGANVLPQFFFQNLFSLFIREIQLGRKICYLESHKSYIIMLKCLPNAHF